MSDPQAPSIDLNTSTETPLSNVAPTLPTVTAEPAGPSIPVPEPNIEPDIVIPKPGREGGTAG